MIKPLIPAIPSKVLTIEGKEYQVYDAVTTCHGTTNGYFCQYLRVSINAVDKRRAVRTFPKIKDVSEKWRAIHLYIQDIATELNDFVEQNYCGDRLRFWDLKPQYNILQTKKGKYNYTYINYLVRGEVGDKQTFVGKLVGKTAEITQADIDARVKEAVEHQRIVNTQYNEKLAAKHKAFRDLVEQQIATRDAEFFGVPLSA